MSGLGKREMARRRRHNIGVYVRRGMSSKEIAPLVGMARSSVNRIRRELGCPAPRKAFAAWRPDNPAVARMTALVSRGKSDRQIAEDVGVSTTTVRAWRRRLRMGPGLARVPQPPRDAQRRTLEALAARRKAVSVAALAEEVGPVTRGSLQARLARMEVRGWVASRWVGGPPAGSNHKVWWLTDGGRDALAGFPALLRARVDGVRPWRLKSKRAFV